jgi:hypothetical protein
MLKDLFYRLFKRSKLKDLENKIFKLEQVCGNLSEISVTSLEKLNDQYAQILELEEKIKDIYSKLRVLHTYIFEEKWDTKH